MESTRQREPATTIELPTAEAPGPVANFGSNAARQDQLALATEARAGGAAAGNLAADGNVAADGNAAAADATGSPIAELVRALGEAASVVLDAMPFHELAPQLPPLLGVPWVREWVRGVPVDELLALPDEAVAPLLEVAIPVGMRVRTTVEGRLAVIVGAMVGGELEVERTREGLALRLDGRFLGTFGVGEGASVVGADASAQVAVSATAEAGVAGGVEWLLPGTIPVAPGRFLLARIGGGPAGTDVVEPWLASTPPTRWELGVCGGSEASGGVDGVGPGWIQRAHAAADLLGRGEWVAGRDGDAPYERVRWRHEAAARAGASAGAVSGSIALEVWGTESAPQALPTRVRVTTVNRVGGDELRDVVELGSVDEAIGVVRAALDADRAAPVGALRIDREHNIDDPEAVRDLVGPALDGGVAADLFFAKAEVQRSARVSVVVDESLPAVPGLDAADAERRRDQQRSVAAAVLGEVYESPGVDPAGFLDHVSVEQVSVEWAQRGALGAGLCAAQVAEANGLARGSLTVAQREDLTGQVDVADIARLLRA